MFADAVRGLDEALVKSASATHGALQQLASRGKDFTDNDLKEALVSLRKLEEDYLAAANRLADAMSGNVRREMMELAVHAQNVGVEASARVATMMGEFASGVSRSDHQILHSSRHRTPSRFVVRSTPYRQADRGGCTKVVEPSARYDISERR
jgi:hypothetical protein